MNPRLAAETRIEALRELARVASVMVDGEEAVDAVDRRAWHYIRNPDPEFRFLVGDYFDVDHGKFLRTKKTLMRLERLVDFPCDASLWLTVPDRPNEVTLLVHNGSLGRWYTFGQASTQAQGALKECLEAGESTTVEDERLLTVVAPVRDSLGDVVGAVEFSSPHPAREDLAPAWS